MPSSASRWPLWRRPAGRSDLIADDSGATAVVIGLCLTTLMGFAGLAVDVGLWYADKRAAQGAADSAAYSGAIDYAGGDTVSGATAAAKNIASEYGFTSGSGGVTVTVNVPPLSGSHTSTAGAVEVIVQKSETLFFSSLFTRSETIAARAVATAGSSGGKYCVEALDPGSGGGVVVNVSNGVTINLPSCGIQDDGTGSCALSVVGGSTINAATIAVVGGICINNGGAITVTGSKTTGAASLPNPYATVPLPAPGPCSTTTYPSYGSFTMSPGTFCGGLSIANGEQVTFQPGVYIIDGGTFSQQGGTTINATGGVTIVLENNANANVANGATLNLTAPSTGSLAGLAIMEDPAASLGGQSYFEGGANINITGAIDLPRETVNFGNGITNNASCTQLIAYDIVFTGGADFANKCSAIGVSGIGASATALVE